MTTILRTHVFPTQVERHEEAREDGKGRVIAGAHIGSNSSAPDHYSASQSSCTLNHHPRMLKMLGVAPGVGVAWFCWG